MAHITVTDENREAVIQRLQRSFELMPRWVKVATAHALSTWMPTPKSGKVSIGDVIRQGNMSNEALEIFVNDIDDNGDLIPEVLQ